MLLPADRIFGRARKFGLVSNEGFDHRARIDDGERDSRSHERRQEQKSAFPTLGE